MKKENNEKRGVYSIENLFHFKCLKCMKWWSIGDPKAAGWNPKKEIYCPLCGHKQKVVKSK